MVGMGAADTQPAAISGACPAKRPFFLTVCAGWKRCEFSVVEKRKPRAFAQHIAEDFRQRTMEVHASPFIFRRGRFFTSLSIALVAVYFGFCWSELNFGHYGTGVRRCRGFPHDIAPEFSSITRPRFAFIMLRRSGRLWRGRWS